MPTHTRVQTEPGTANFLKAGGQGWVLPVLSSSILVLGPWGGDCPATGLACPPPPYPFALSLLFLESELLFLHHQSWTRTTVTFGPQKLGWEVGFAGV